MATTYYGLTSWQWLLVAIAAFAQALTSTTGGAELLGGLVGAGIGYYIVARLLAMASRGVRRRVGRRLASDS